MVPEDLLMIALLPLLGGWALWLLWKRYQLQSRARMQRDETFRHLIDKFGSAEELADFLQSEAGRRLLEDPVGPAGRPGSPSRRLLLGGVLLSALGVAFFVNGLRYRGMTDINFVREALGFANWATIFGTLGAALLLLAALFHFLVQRRP